MKKLLPNIILSIFILCSCSAVADGRSVVAVVNDQIITQYDLEDQKRFIMSMYQIDMSKPNMQNIIERKALEALIESSVLRNFTEEQGIVTTQSEIDSIITNIEKNNKMSPGGISKMLKENGVDKTTFTNQLVADKIKNGLTGQLASTFKISKSEQNWILANYLKNDFKVEYTLFETENDSNKYYENLKKLHKMAYQGDNCQNIKESAYAKFAKKTQIINSIRKLTPKTRSVVIDTDKVSNIYKENGKYKFICIKEKHPFNNQKTTQEEFINKLYQSRVSKQTIEFIANIKAKAYIKILRADLK